MDHIIDHIKESVNDTRVELQGVLNRRLDLSLDTLARDLTEYVRDAVANHIRDLTRESTTNGQVPSEESTHQVETVNQNNSNNNQSNQQHESETQSVNNDPPGTVPPPSKDSIIKSEPSDHQVGPFTPEQDICHCPHIPAGHCSQDANDQVKEESDDQQEDSAHQDRQQLQQQPRVNKRPLKAPRVMQKAQKKKNLSTESKKKHQHGQQNKEPGVTIPQCTPSTSGLNSIRGMPSTSRGLPGQGSSCASHRSKLMDEEKEDEFLDSEDDENDEDYNYDDDDSSDSDDDYSDDDDDDSEVDHEVAHPRTIRQDLPKSNGSMAIQREQLDTANGGEIANRSTSNPIQPNPPQPNPNRPFKCGQCRKRFTRKDLLGAHMRTHTGERPYECAYCEMKFAARTTRRVHEQAKHLHVKPYRCKQCGYNATQQSNMIIHIRMVHFGLPRTFKQQHELNIVDTRDPKKLLEKV